MMSYGISYRILNNMFIFEGIIIGFLGIIFGFVSFLGFTDLIGLAFEYALNTPIHFSPSHAKLPLIATMAVILLMIVLATTLAVHNIISKNPAELLKV